jgi:hypothetical protein
LFIQKILFKQPTPNDGYPDPPVSALGYK